MNAMHRKALSGIVLIIIALGLFSFLLITSSPQNTQNSKGKTVIMMMDALGWDIVTENIGSLPNIRHIADNGVHGKLKPVSPTFSVANHAAFFSSKRSDKMDWYYAFIFMPPGGWDCSKSFTRELPSVESDTDVLKTLTSTGKRVSRVMIPNGESLDAGAVQNALENSDVLYIYDPTPDSLGHITNITDKKNALSYLKISDANLGMVLDALRSRGLLEKSNIIVFGDHGMAAIDKFPKWRLIVEDLEAMGVSEDNACYWNDAGVSVRFWFRNESAQKQLEPKIRDYFMNRVADRECFFVPDGEYLRSHNVLHPDAEKKRASLGDLIVGVNVKCKLVYEGVIPVFLQDFEEKLHEVDAYVSMHGYLDNDHEETIAFIGMTGPLFRKNAQVEMDMVDVAPTLMCGMGYKNEDYYNTIDGKARCDVVNECRC